MLVFALALALADPAPPAPPRSVLVLDLVGSDVPASVPRLLSSLLAGEVARSGLKTLSQDEMRRVVALESEKAAMGCDTSSCLAEMASAMGVDYVVFGDVGKLGNAYIVTLRLFDSKRGDAVSRDTLQAADMDGVRQGVAASVSRLMAPIGVATATATATTATAPPEEPKSASSPLLIPGIAIAAIGGVATTGAAIGAVVIDSTLGDPGASSRDKRTALDVGPWAIVGAAVGSLVTLVGAGVIGFALMESP